MSEPKGSGWSVQRFVPMSQVYERSRGRARNVVHLIAPEGFESGRLKRPRGGAICGARWGWYPADDPKGHPACPKCADVAKRHGIAWPATFDERGDLLEVLPVGA